MSDDPSKTDWSVDPDSAEWAEREKLFRESLRRSSPIGPNEFAALDAALLSEEEMKSLTRLLQGRGNSFDRSICAHALAEQRQATGDK
jgi:hypothetical protein